MSHTHKRRDIDRAPRPPRPRPDSEKRWCWRDALEKGDDADGESAADAPKLHDASNRAQDDAGWV